MHDSRGRGETNCMHDSRGRGGTNCMHDRRGREVLIVCMIVEGEGD